MDEKQLAVSMRLLDEERKNLRLKSLKFLRANLCRITDELVKRKVNRGYGADLTDTRIAESLETLKP